MSQWLKKYPYGVLGAGFGLGLLVGVGMLAGALAAVALQDSRQFTFPETALHASATDAGETFSMATGQIAEGVEGVFFLDYLTGDLSCWVLNRRTGQLGGYFRHNVITDLGIDQSRKKAKYLMVTGLAPVNRGSSSVRPADSVVYVADATTGAFVAYMLPWNRNAYATGSSQMSDMMKVGQGSIRGNLNVRGQ